MNKIEIVIQNGDTLFYPMVEDDISFSTSRKGEPGKLTFKVIKDEILNFNEGNAVTFRYGGVSVFYGFVFAKNRSKDGLISVTAYDQLRYLKNKDTYVYSNKTAGELFKLLADDFKLRTGKIDNTNYKIASRIEENKTLFDIIQNALDITLENTNKMYVLYDNTGKMCLENIENLKLNIMLDENSAEDYNYSSSIDVQTYNQIKLSYENEQAGKREIYITKSSENINNWGVLQFFDTIDENTNGRAKAEALLKLYNQKTRSLSINKAMGDMRVRGGTSVIVSLNLGDLKVQNYMLVEKVTHIFKDNEHFMDLTLRGGVFNG